MWWITRRRRDRGAAALIVTVLFASGVLLGCAALTVDVGQLYSERRQLQNGADAAALSLAQICAAGGACSFSDADSAALGANRISKLNNANAKDDYAAFNSTFKASYDNGLCGRATALPSCAAPTGSLLDCPPLPSWLSANAAIPYVEVHNLTQTDASGNHILPTAFGRAVTGFSGAAVSSCSRAAWGTPAGPPTPTIPVAISGCEWRYNTNGTVNGTGGSYYAGPIYNGVAGNYGYNGGALQATWPTASKQKDPADTPNLGGEITIWIENPETNQNSNGKNDKYPPVCPWSENMGNANHDLPGGFGYLETDPSNSCLPLVMGANRDWYHSDPGNSVTCDINKYVGTVVSVPIFDCTSTYLPGAPVTDCHLGNGTNAYYHRQGFAKFYLSGFSLNVKGKPANFHNSLIPPNKAPCNGGDSCISGWFVKDSVDAAAIGGPPGGSNSFDTYAIVSAG
ncbi:MAG: Tad domain-containing protein [Lapillicoccus sp.]